MWPGTPLASQALSLPPGKASGSLLWQWVVVGIFLWSLKQHLSVGDNNESFSDTITQIVNTKTSIKYWTYWLYVNIKIIDSLQMSTCPTGEEELQKQQCDKRTFQIYVRISWQKKKLWSSLITLLLSKTTPVKTKTQPWCWFPDQPDQSPQLPTSYHSLQPSGLWCYELWTLSSAGPLLAQRQKQDCGCSTTGPSDLSITQSCVVFSQLLSTFSPDWALRPLDQLYNKSHILLHIWQLMNHHHHHHPVWCAEGLEVLHQSVTPPCTLQCWSL